MQVRPRELSTAREQKLGRLTAAVARSGDHYTVLSVSRTASAEEIKVAYRRLAREYHPDRNPGDAEAEESFKLVSEAWRILGDADRRRDYDAELAAPTQRTGPVKPNPFGPRRGADLEVDARVPFSTALEGGEVRLTVQGTAACDGCAGTGSAKRARPAGCPTCKGGGLVRNSSGTARACGQCGGSGFVLPDPCPACGTKGFKEVQRRMTVRIPPGVRHGTRIRLQGKGRVGVRGGEDGDLFVVMQVDDSSVFTGRGDDLEVEIPITVTEAMLGAEVRVPTLNGSKPLRLDPGTQHGALKRLRGGGPPKLDGSGNGDILYRIKVLIPGDLTDPQRAAAEALAETLDSADPRADLTARAERSTG